VTPKTTGGCVLDSGRCTLHPLRTSDADALHVLWTSRGVRRFLWDDAIVPFETTAGAIERSRQMFASDGFGLWGLWPRASPALSGFAGLWPFRDPPEIELLYGTAEPLWGEGYATEAARAVIAHCFSALDMPVVRASTDAPNLASIRVLEKLGFVPTRRAAVGGLDTVFFELWR
jgi:ribosomal-protein-alanine N-acetyltransferase